MKTLTLREARAKAGLTQDDLAAMSGVDQTSISAIECGRRTNPTIDTAVRLATALGVALTDLTFQPRMKRERTPPDASEGKSSAVSVEEAV